MTIRNGPDPAVLAFMATLKGGATTDTVPDPNSLEEMTKRAEITNARFFQSIMPPDPDDPMAVRKANAKSRPVWANVGRANAKRRIGAR